MQSDGTLAAVVRRIQVHAKNWEHHAAHQQRYSGADERATSGFAAEVEKVAGSKDRKVVLYCASEKYDASSTAARKLDDAGLEKIYDYEGGTRDWLQNH